MNHFLQRKVFIYPCYENRSKKSCYENRQPQRPQYYFYFKLTEAIVKIYMEHFCNIATSSFQMGLLQFKGMRDFLIN